MNRFNVVLRDGQHVSGEFTQETLCDGTIKFERREGYKVCEKYTFNVDHVVYCRRVYG